MRSLLGHILATAHAMKHELLVGCGTGTVNILSATCGVCVKLIATAGCRAATEYRSSRRVQRDAYEIILKPKN